MRVYDISDRRQANILRKIAVKAIIDRELLLARKLPRQVLLVVTLSTVTKYHFLVHVLSPGL